MEIGPLIGLALLTALIALLWWDRLRRSSLTSHERAREDEEARREATIW